MSSGLSRSCAPRPTREPVVQCTPLVAVEYERQSYEPVSRREVALKFPRPRHRPDSVLIVYRIPDATLVKKVRLHESGPCHARGSPSIPGNFSATHIFLLFYLRYFLPAVLLFPTRIASVDDRLARHRITREYLQPSSD